MKYSIKYSSKFKKGVKRCEKRGLDIALLKKAIALLGETGTLPPYYQAHKLSGTYQGFCECHIQNDWLMIWEQDEEEITLVLTDTGTHSDLF